MRTFARLAAESVESAAVEMNRALGFAVELGGGRLSPAGEAQVLQRAVFSEGNLLLAALDSADGRPLLHLADERVFPRGAGRPHSPHEARHGGAPPRQAAFSVADTGYGIPKEKLAGVFLPFEQVSAEDQNTGFGLGLSLVKEFIELHGGRIRVESELGKGTTFTFTLPLAPATAPPRAEPREAGR